MKDRLNQALKSLRGVFLIAVLGSLVLAVFFLLFIGPTTASIEALERRIAELELQQEKISLLMPVYEELKRQALPEPPPDMAVPPASPLPQGEIATVIPLFRDLAARSGLPGLTVAPNLESLEATPGRLSVSIQGRGTFFALRDYLFALARLPSFGGIAAVSVIQAGPGEGDKQMELELWLATTQ